MCTSPRLDGPVLEHLDARVAQRVPHREAGAPPVVVAEHGERAERRAQPGELGRDLRGAMRPPHSGWSSVKSPSRSIASGASSLRRSTARATASRPACGRRRGGRQHADPQAVERGGPARQCERPVHRTSRRGSITPAQASSRPPPRQWLSQRCEHLVAARHRRAGARRRGRQRSGGEREAHGLAERPAGRQLGGERAVDGVAGAGRVDDRDGRSRQALCGSESSSSAPCAPSVTSTGADVCAASTRAAASTSASPVSSRASSALGVRTAPVEAGPRRPGRRRVEHDEPARRARGAKPGGDRRLRHLVAEQDDAARAGRAGRLRREPAPLDRGGVERRVRARGHRDLVLARRRRRRSRRRRSGRPRGERRGRCRRPRRRAPRAPRRPSRRRPPRRPSPPRRPPAPRPPPGSRPCRRRGARTCRRPPSHPRAAAARRTRRGRRSPIPRRRPAPSARRRNDGARDLAERDRRRGAVAAPAAQGHRVAVLEERALPPSARPAARGRPGELDQAARRSPARRRRSCRRRRGRRGGRWCR